MLPCQTKLKFHRNLISNYCSILFINSALLGTLQDKRCIRWDSNSSRAHKIQWETAVISVLIAE